MKVYAVKIKDIDEKVLKNLLFLISDERRKSVERYVNKIDKLRGVIAELLVRKIVSEKFSINNKEIIISKKEYGKPFLKNNPDFNYNISHSGQWVVCAIDDADIGIDIEEIKKIDYSGIIKAFFHYKEAEFILKSDRSNIIKNFYRIWTLKESYIKADGRGMHIPLNSFYISIDSIDKITIHTNNSLSKYFFRELTLDLRYKISLCSLKNNIPEDIIEISQDELIFNW